MAEFSFKGINLTADGEKFFAELNKLKESEIHVGFQAGENNYPDGADLVQIACYNEYGTSRIPARPFMKQSWENHKPELNKMCAKAFKTIANGGTAEAACKMVGVFGVGLVQDEIVNGGFAPNAPSTIAKKGSSQPLIDTGHMRQSVKYVIKKG